MKKTMKFSVSFLLLALLAFAGVASIDWAPTPMACEPHGLKQSPCMDTKD